MDTYKALVSACLPDWNAHRRAAGYYRNAVTVDLDRATQPLLAVDWRAAPLQLAHVYARWRLVSTVRYRSPKLRPPVIGTRMPEELVHGWNI